MLLVWYAQYLSRSLKAHTSIVAYLSGVKTLHILLNYSVQGFHGFFLKLTLRGLRRDNQHVVRHVAPMTPAILHIIYDSLDHDNPTHAVFWGISILTFMLLFRKSNLVPDKVDEFNAKHQICHSDCVIDKDNQRVVVSIQWAKNEQFSQELLMFPLPALSGLVLCPLQAIKNIRRLIPFQP